MKNKTLKDCKDLEEARAEAIKWVKEDIEHQKGLKDGTYDHLIAEARIDIFTIFFDITDEELTK